MLTIYESFSDFFTDTIPIFISKLNQTDYHILNSLKNISVNSYNKILHIFDDDPVILDKLKKLLSYLKYKMEVSSNNFQNMTDDLTSDLKHNIGTNSKKFLLRSNSLLNRITTPSQEFEKEYYLDKDQLDIQLNNQKNDYDIEQFVLKNKYRIKKLLNYIEFKSS